jgi:cytochrome c553
LRIMQISGTNPAAVRRLLAAVAIGAMLLPANAQVTQQATPPWAYAVQKTPLQHFPDDEVPQHLAGSNAAFSRVEIRDAFTAPDWFPADHPLMPPIVAHGRKPVVLACGYCHLPTGQGRPENAALAGLSSEYIIEQINSFRSGQRQSSEPRMVPPKRMISTAIGATDTEVKAAAEYFSRLPFTARIRVVEVQLAPRTYVEDSMLMPSPDGQTEPIGQRIVELPENVARTQLRDPRSGFVAYVPIGSIKAGGILVSSGGGKTLQCATCHGVDLKGSAIGPPLAGLSPTYMVRQLYDIQSGARGGPAVKVMQAVVAKLAVEDMVSIAAFLASREP